MHGQPVSEPHTHVHYYRLAFILGALTAIGPLAIDMYLPALPTIAREFGTAASVVQSSLAAYFIGIAIGQAFYGPLSDRLGRKPILYLGLVLFMVSSIGCARAESVNALIAFRFLQALGGCAPIVIPRAIVRDHFDQSGSVRMLSVLMLVMGLAPILAPLIGGQLLVHFGWRAVFWLLTAYAATWVAVVAIFLPESLPSARRLRHPIKDVLQVYWRLARDRKFMGHALSGAFIFAGLLAYISGSPVVFIELFDVPPERYGVYFGINAVGIIAASQINRWLVGRVETHRIVSIVLVVAMTAGACSRARCIQRIRGIRGHPRSALLLHRLPRLRSAEHDGSRDGASRESRRQCVGTPGHVSIRWWCDCRQPGGRVRQRHTSADGGCRGWLWRDRVSRQPVRDDLTREPRQSAGKQSSA